MTEYTRTGRFRGAAFRMADFTGATFRDCDLTQVRIVSSQVNDLRISGFDGRAGTVVVDDVDVTAYVAAELDRRHFERVQLRAMRTADEYRAMWETLERLWAEAVARAEQIPESARAERVDDEWSFVETLRHLVFAVDSWIGRMIRNEPEPYHRLGLPPTDTSAATAKGLGIEVDAQPSYAEVLALFTESRARVRGMLEALTDSDLEQTRTGVLSPEFGEETHSVGECLTVVMNEHCEHHRFAVRDLAVLEAR